MWGCGWFKILNYIYFFNGFDHSSNLTKTNQPDPTRPGNNFSLLKHVRSSWNIQDISHTFYQHDLCQRWPPPTSLHSGTINVIQIPNFSFLCHIMSDLHQTFRISCISFKTWFMMSKMTPSFKSPFRNPESHPNPQLLLSLQIMSDLDQTYRISPISSKTWFRMSKMTPSFKHPVRNPQRPLSPQLLLSKSNFQYRPFGNYTI